MNPSHVSNRSSRRQRHTGFTLIEVLVAIVVLSFGMLGMVGLQAASLQANRDARQQSAAINLAKELAEMMRGNKDVALASDASNFYVGDFSGSPLTTPSASYCLTAGNACASVGDVAKAELTEWLTRVESELPGARVKICSDSAPYVGDLPRWDCTSAGSTDVMVVKIGWTRSSTRKATAQGDNALNQATVPSVVLPVTAGSKT